MRLVVVVLVPDESAVILTFSRGLRHGPRRLQILFLTAPSQLLLSSSVNPTWHVQPTAPTNQIAVKRSDMGIPPIDLQHEWLAVLVSDPLPVVRQPGQIPIVVIVKSSHRPEHAGSALTRYIVSIPKPSVYRRLQDCSFSSYPGHYFVCLCLCSLEQEEVILSLFSIDQLDQIITQFFVPGGEWPIRPCSVKAPLLPCIRLIGLELLSRVH